MVKSLGQDKFIIEALKLLTDYPRLGLISKDNRTVLGGDFELYDESNTFLDSYKVEICPTDAYPYQFPLVYEIGKKLPINIDWHVYPDGHLCIKTIPEEQITCARGITLKYFLEEELKPYLFNQVHRRTFGYYKSERSHGMRGVLEFYEGFFKTRDLLEIVSLLTFIATGNEPGRSSECFCNRDVLYRKCHRDQYRKMKLLGREAIFTLLSDLIHYPLFFSRHPLEVMKLRQQINNNPIKTLL